MTLLLGGWGESLDQAPAVQDVAGGGVDGAVRGDAGHGEQPLHSRRRNIHGGGKWGGRGDWGRAGDRQVLNAVDPSRLTGRILGW